MCLQRRLSMFPFQQNNELSSKQNADFKKELFFVFLDNANGKKMISQKDNGPPRFSTTKHSHSINLTLTQPLPRKYLIVYNNNFKATMYSISNHHPFTCNYLYMDRQAQVQINIYLGVRHPLGDANTDGERADQQSNMKRPFKNKLTVF